MKAFSALFLAAALGVVPVFAGPLSQTCLTGNRAAASLLIPYFEVDLADPDGITTLVSIGNAHDQPILARVVVWTDWGLSTINFDLALDADQAQSLNLRAILAGQVPSTGDGLGGQLNAPNCTFPISPPPFNLQELQARHTGQPSPFSGLCYGSGRLGPNVATGYLTVDVVRDCSTGAIPGDPGYFDDGQGLATNDNHLFGDFFLLEPGQDFAQGLKAVPLVADTELFEPVGVFRTFYRDRGVGDADDRAPLSSLHRTRFLNGGGFDGATDLLIWNAGLGAGAEPKTCGSGPFDGAGALPFISLDIASEAGEPLGNFGIAPPANAFRIPIGGEEIPLAADTFGTVEIDAVLLGCLFLLPCPEPLQSWAASLFRADGRFSVGVPATRLADPCQ